MMRSRSGSSDRRMDIENQFSQTVNEMVPDAVLSHIPGLSRRPSIPKELVDTYFCNICFSKDSVDRAFALSGCDHQFCRECITHFVTNKINHGQVNMTCFHPLHIDGVDNVTCRTPIAEHDIKELVTDETWNKYKRFKANLENTLSRQCPYCDHTQIGDPKEPMMRCKNPECGEMYCLYHNNAHPVDVSCEEYELSMAKETKINDMALAELGNDAKPCPQCKFVIIKSGGCNQVKCVKCGCSFCWLCCQIIEDAVIPEHYKSGGCQGMQFAGMEDDIQLTGFQMIGATVLFLLLLIPSWAIGLVSALVLYPFILCFLGTDYKFFDVLLRLTIVWMIIFIIIFVAPVVLVVMAVVAGCKSIGRRVCGRKARNEAPRQQEEIAAGARNV